MGNLLEVYRKQIGYILSVPERTLRSLAAVAGGATWLMTETLIPSSLKSSSLYKIFVGDVQKFVIEKIAKIPRQEQESPSSEPLDDNYLRRKILGGALETAGLLAMHFSPLWVFAIGADAAGGSKAYLKRLIRQLKRNGVLPEDAQATELAELLDLLQFAARRGATAIDTPPLNRQELDQLANELKLSFGLMFAKTSGLVPHFENLWKRMERLSSQQEIALEQVEGIMTVDLARLGLKGFSATLAAGQAGADLFGEQILESYRATLDRIAAEGVENYLQKNMQPFLQAAAVHFDPDSVTWIESKIPGRSGGDTVEAQQDPS